MPEAGIPAASRSFPRPGNAPGSSGIEWFTVDPAGYVPDTDAKGKTVFGLTVPDGQVFKQSGTA